MFVHKVYKLYVTIRISEGIVPAGEECYTLKKAWKEMSEADQYNIYLINALLVIAQDPLGAEISGLHKGYTLKLFRSHSAERRPGL